MSDTVQKLANFVINTGYDDLPEDIVHAAKYLLLDSFGCALSSVTTDRGKMSIAMARKMGGPPESTIIGVGDKVSKTVRTDVVFAGAEEDGTDPGAVYKVETSVLAGGISGKDP